MDLYSFRSFDAQVGDEIATWIKAQAQHWHTPAGLLMGQTGRLGKKGPLSKFGLLTG
jgi:hypothetical protein